jgi:hypothetical protein
MTLAKKLVLLVLVSALLAAGLYACGRGGTPGQKLDRAIDRTGEKLKEAGEALQSKQ